MTRMLPTVTSYHGGPCLLALSAATAPSVAALLSFDIMLYMRLRCFAKNREAAEMGRVHVAARQLVADFPHFDPLRFSADHSSLAHTLGPPSCRWEVYTSRPSSLFSAA